MPATSGISWLIKIDDVGGGSATSIGGQRNGTLTINSGTIDITSKDGASWVETISGVKSWTVSGDGITLEGDSGLEELIDKTIAGTAVDVTVTTPNGRNFTGSGTISSYEESAPYDGAYSYSLTIEGNGALAEA